MTDKQRKRLGVLTSGGDAPGMNAAVRSVVRAALANGVEVYAVYEGYQGMVDGGDLIRPVGWDDVGGILHRGGTIIGSARSATFRTRDGRLQAARNLLARNIDSLVIIGGDGSLTGADIFRREWPELLAELVAAGELAQEQAAQHPQLKIVGLVGSIDNDMFGTDMTIGADTALHRITSAVDAISSTAASHQRSFVVEVMGRHCGYLALMSALATSAEWVIFPEHPPEGDNWEQQMCDMLSAGRRAGRRDSIVIIAEGAQDRHGHPITSQYIKRVLEERLGEDTRVTILGHVQRGGSPTAFDRNMSTILGHAAVEELLAHAGEEPQVIGLSGNRVTRTPLQRCIEETRTVAKAIDAHDYDRAMRLRGRSFKDAWRIHKSLSQALPRAPREGQRRLRLAVMHAGGLAPGMNTAVRAAVRLGVDLGHIMLGVNNGFRGLITGDLREMDWMSVNGWATMGGAQLGANRKEPSEKDLRAIARTIERHELDGILMIGGWAGYQTAYRLASLRETYPAFRVPIVCLPATIDNNLPGSELSIGADTALNNIVDALDKIKQSAVASQRVFVVEVMGRYCGYLALMSGLATGAERVYMNEEGVNLRDLQTDVARLIKGFRQGKRLGLVIRNEETDSIYTTDVISRLFAAEGNEHFDVRHAILGHIQQGGDPTPFDRIQATRLAALCVEHLIEQAGSDQPSSAFIGLQGGEVVFTPLEQFPSMVDEHAQRPSEQWWMVLRSIADLLSRRQ